MAHYDILQAIYFNPRSHERSDALIIHFVRGLLISIHAPTRGATQMYNGIQSVYKISIHAPTRGATQQAEVQL